MNLWPFFLVSPADKTNMSKGQYARSEKLNIVSALNIFVAYVAIGFKSHA